MTTALSAPPTYLPPGLLATAVTFAGSPAGPAGPRAPAGPAAPGSPFGPGAPARAAEPRTKSAGFSEPSFTFAEVTALRAMCDERTLPFESLTAAYELPPSATKRARVAMTLAYESRLSMRAAHPTAVAARQRPGKRDAPRRQSRPGCTGIALGLLAFRDAPALHHLRGHGGALLAAAGVRGLVVVGDDLLRGRPRGVAS